MMESHWIVVIMSVMFLISAHEFGGTVMMKISLKSVIYQKGFIIETLTNQQKRKEINAMFNRCIVCCLYHNNPSDKTQLQLFSRIRNHVQKYSHEESS